MSEFVRVVAASDLPPGSAMEARVGNRAVALFNASGEFYAIDNRCQHRGGPLGQGSLDGTTVICPWHAWTFDVTTGYSTVNPELRVARYEVKVEQGDVYVKAE